jgi:hypothetical protein
MNEEALKRGMAAWQKEHPKATLRQIEAELDRRAAMVRAAVAGEDPAGTHQQAECAAGAAYMELAPLRGGRLQRFVRPHPVRD